MEVFKRLSLFAMVTVAVIVLIVWSVDSFGFRSPLCAFLVNWLTLSWVATASLVFYLSLPAEYYDIKPFEQTGQVYERLGIRLFKMLVRRGPLSIFSRGLRLPRDKTISALRSLDNEMRKAETAHVLVFVLMLLFVSYALLKGWLDAVAWILAFNVLLNPYPIMLQRYNRIKLRQLIYKQDV